MTVCSIKRFARFLSKAICHETLKICFDLYNVVSLHLQFYNHEYDLNSTDLNTLFTSHVLRTMKA